MKRDELNNIITNTFDNIKSLSTNKGHEYSGEKDALSNFKRHAETIGITPLQVWEVYAGKHYDSICTFIKDHANNIDRKLTEPIDGRIDDLIVYLLLLKALIQENYSIVLKDVSHL
jgi:hypothetical protein